MKTRDRQLKILEKVDQIERETKHTKGPWKPTNHINQITPHQRVSYVEAKNEIIAQCWPGADRGLTKDEYDKELLANARLIAAAPDMLEALERLIANNGTGAMEWAINNARQAIAKAKGE